jgi:hypothetical protein
LTGAIVTPQVAQTNPERTHGSECVQASLPIKSIDWLMRDNQTVETPCTDGIDAKACMVACMMYN